MLSFWKFFFKALKAANACSLHNPMQGAPEELFVIHCTGQLPGKRRDKEMFGNLHEEREGALMKTVIASWW